MTLDDIESFIEVDQQDASQEELVAVVEGLPPEDLTSKPCPKCGGLVPMKARNRVRHLMTTAGELRLSRNYHYCKTCQSGFHPRDIELKLPEEGEVSDAMEKRILDFAVNTSFGESAERWGVHYPFPISANLFRRVVNRVGRRREQAHSLLALQQAALPSPQYPPKSLVIAGDGSMLLTHQGWKEAKVAVVARGESIIPGLADWQLRIRQLVEANSPDAAIRELLDCLPFTTTDDQLAALDSLVRYYRNNEKRMRYTAFREAGLPIGSGIVESAHKHILQARMKQAGQRWSMLRGRRMVQLRALYRTAGPRRFHWAIREALKVPPSRPHTAVPNAPRRVKRDFVPTAISLYNRSRASN